MGSCTHHFPSSCDFAIARRGFIGCCADRVLCGMTGYAGAAYRNAEDCRTPHEEVWTRTCTCVWGARSPLQSTNPPAGSRVPRSHLRCRAPHIGQRAAPSEVATGRTVIRSCAACAAGDRGPSGRGAFACRCMPPHVAHVKAHLCETSDYGTSVSASSHRSKIPTHTRQQAHR